jgi:preprotein translocase subunit SecA
MKHFIIILSVFLGFTATPAVAAHHENGDHDHGQAQHAGMAAAGGKIPRPGQAVRSGAPATAGQTGPATPAKRDKAKVGRNDPCPCGSGKKYKNCHGRQEA